MKELCNCGNVAVYFYMPATDKEFGNRYFCENCVSRGCSCNHRYVDIDAYHPPLDNPDLPTDKDKPFKWIIKNKIWCHVDEQGREYPCCEYDYSEDGYDKD